MEKKKAVQWFRRETPLLFLIAIAFHTKQVVCLTLTQQLTHFTTLELHLHPLLLLTCSQPPQTTLWRDAAITDVMLGEESVWHKHFRNMVIVLYITR